jgi:hypothetical protein
MNPFENQTRKARELDPLPAMDHRRDHLDLSAFPNPVVDQVQDAADDTFDTGIGLHDLARVALSPGRTAILESAHAQSGGAAVWRRRKRAEARDLLALSQIAPPGRLQAQYLDLSESLRAVVLLEVPVPVRTGQSDSFGVADRAVLGLTYPREALVQPLPGYAFIQILFPESVWHPNVAVGHGQPLCLGAQLPAGIRVKELILLAYGALSMQTITVDERDSAGVLNCDAARWWQQNLERIPLARTPFLGRSEAVSVDSRPTLVDAGRRRL